MHVSAFKSLQGYLYLGSPYSKYPLGAETAYRHICKISGDLVKLGVPIFSPIAHSHSIAVESGIDIYSHAIWMPVDQPFMDAALGMIIAPMEGWRESYGVKLEIEEFERGFKPIFTMDLTFELSALNSTARKIIETFQEAA